MFLVCLADRCFVFVKNRVLIIEKLSLRIYNLILFNLLLTG